MSPLVLAALAAMGGVGAATRYLVDDLINRLWRVSFPLATLTINVSGSFLIGLFAATLGADSPELFAVLATGFCGGYTTFSTATVEAVRLAREGAWRRSALAIVGTLVLCTTAATLGVLLGRAVG